MKQEIHHNAFALKNSGLDAFLYADVGTEANGSALTILSMLARLGSDPWAEAARWAALPRIEVVDILARNIACMPLAPSALAEARSTAARLVQLLPGTRRDVSKGGAATPAAALAVPRWVPMALLFCTVLVGMALSALFTPKPTPATATSPRQSTAQGHSVLP